MAATVAVVEEDIVGHVPHELGGLVLYELGGLAPHEPRQVQSP